MKNGVKFVMKSSEHFRALFPEERGAAKFHQKFHGIFHGNFHARFQEKISRQHFCTPCRSDTSLHRKRRCGLERPMKGPSAPLGNPNPSSELWATLTSFFGSRSDVCVFQYVRSEKWGATERPTGCTHRRLFKLQGCQV